MATREEDLRAPDVEAIMSRIRKTAKAELANAEPLWPSYEPRKLDLPPAGSLVHSEELRYLNANWHNWLSASEITSHRKFIGPIIVKAKRFVLDLIWNNLLKGYFERERQFNMNLVRLLNYSAKYVDDRQGSVFWDIINKVDRDIAGVNERIDGIYDEANATLRAIENQVTARINGLEASSSISGQKFVEMKVELERLDTIARGIERVIALAATGRAPSEVNGQPVPEVMAFNPPNGVDYLLLENRFRGSRELIKERLADYLPLFKEAPGRILDLGCGRGEFLELLRENGKESVGIDINEAMIATCRESGFDAQLKDGLSFLESLPDRSLGGVFAAQVVEHLTRSQLEQLFELCARKVAPGGRVAFETINPQSFVALARNFFRDPTHIWPLHPDTLRFMMEMKGIKSEQVIMRSPYPLEVTLQPIAISEHLPARWKTTLDSINDNIARLNDVMFGHQDYCVVGVIEGR